MLVTEPALAWSGAPPQTKAFAIIADDPDPADIRHWVLYGMAGTRTSLPEGVTEGANVVFGASGRCGTGWWGPCPRAGHPSHSYIITVYALDGPVALVPGATSAQLLTAMTGNVIATGTLVGTAQQ